MRLYKIEYDDKYTKGNDAPWDFEKVAVKSFAEALTRAHKKLKKQTEWSIRQIVLLEQV